MPNMEDVPIEINLSWTCEPKDEQTVDYMSITLTVETHFCILVKKGCYQNIGCIKRQQIMWQWYDLPDT